MKITILNGDLSPEKSEFSEFMEKLTKNISEKNHIEHFQLSEMNLHYCTGCWSCWWKTPGLCALKDDADNIFRSVINSDFFIFASPLYAGFTSSSLKKITDRLVILLHPYMELIQDECHHRKRYEKYPHFGLILQKENDTDKEDIKIISDIYSRLAINFHSKLRYVKFIETNNIEEIFHETCNI
jgi:multimeric flavodoxin WrbA